MVLSVMAMRCAGYCGQLLGDHWVMWANWRGNVMYFCDDDCLRRWLEALEAEALGRVRSQLGGGAFDDW